MTCPCTLLDLVTRFLAAVALMLIVAGIIRLLFAKEPPDPGGS